MLCMLPDDMAFSAQVASFLKVCDVLDLLRLCKDGEVTDTMLHEAIIAHLIAFQVAYGIVGWIPKHHLAYHLSRYLRKYGLLLSTLTQERMHKVVKRWARDRFRQFSFERGLMEELTLDHLNQLEHSWWILGLQEPIQEPKPRLLRELRAKYPAANDFATSSSVRVPNGSIVHGGDKAFVLHERQLVLVEVLWVASYDNNLIACVDLWDEIAGDAASERGRAVTFKKMQRSIILDCGQFVSAATTWDQGEFVVALLPALPHAAF